MRRAIRATMMGLCTLRGGNWHSHQSAAPREGGRRPGVGVEQRREFIDNVLYESKQPMFFRAKRRAAAHRVYLQESHIHTLVNLVLLSGLPIARPRTLELDYPARTPPSRTSRQDPACYIYPWRAVNNPCIDPSCTSATGTGASLTSNAPSSHCSARAQSSTSSTAPSHAG